jgi:zinc/manganese transport system substrate-binding protein
VKHRLALVPLVPLVALVLAGCSGTPSAEASGLSVVASTDVYGDIARTVGGDLVTVSSLIDSGGQDPHSYEASARDRLAVNRADLVIANGGGYDDFMTRLAADSEGELLTVVEVLGLDGGADHDHGEEAEREEAEGDGHGHLEGLNEHVWYDLHYVDEFAGDLSEHLADLDPDNASTYNDNYAAFSAQLTELEGRTAAIADENRGATVAITEPVPLYLLESAGLVNVTPDEFSEAVEEGTDVGPLVLQQTEELVGEVSLLAYNEQTSGAETEAVRSAAESAGVPVVNFTETLPDDEDYVSWMTANIDAIENALAS